MPVTSVVVITQFTLEEVDGSIRESVLAAAGNAEVRESSLGLSSWSNQTHQPAVTNPAASAVAGGYETREPVQEFWSDSPDNQPDLLFRKRFAFGRDIRENFEQPARPGQVALGVVGDTGQRWGNLDSNSGHLQYDRVFSLDSGTDILEFWVYGTGSARELLSAEDSHFSVNEMGPVTGEATVSEYPFLLDALPVPGSAKNPIATDIYIRVGNFTSVFDADTFKLFVNDQLQSTLVVDEFFGGLGGFDVTWPNTMLFEYDAQVDVRWEFTDTEIPANRFVVKYPFYTVPDLSGPRVTGLVPANEAIDVGIQNTIQFELEDFENDVDIDSLVLYVNNQRVEDGVTGTLELVRFQNKKGYTVKYTPAQPWLYGDLIPVAIFVQDTSKNSNETFFTYSFTTLESLAPRLINLRPMTCTVAIPVGTHVSLDIVDGGHGLDKTSITFTVEDIERGGQIALIPIVHRDE